MLKMLANGRKLGAIGASHQQAIDQASSPQIKQRHAPITPAFLSAAATAPGTYPVVYSPVPTIKTLILLIKHPQRDHCFR